MNKFITKPGLDNPKNEPIYRLIVDELKDQIKDMPPDDLFLSERILAEQYKISRMTARKIVTILVEKGYLYRLQNKGTYIAKRVERRTTSNYFALLNPNAKFRLLKMNFITIDEQLREYFHCEVNENAYKYYFLVKEDEVVKSVEEIFFLWKADFSRYFIEPKKIAVMQGVLATKKIQQNIHAIRVPTQYQKLLGLMSGEPITLIESLIFDETETVLMFVRSYLHPENTLVCIAE